MIVGEINNCHWQLFRADILVHWKHIHRRCNDSWAIEYTHIYTFPSSNTENKNINNGLGEAGQKKFLICSIYFYSTLVYFLFVVLVYFVYNFIEYRILIESSLVLIFFFLIFFSISISWVVGSLGQFCEIKWNVIPIKSIVNNS